MPKTVITPADITEAVATVASFPSIYRPTRPLPTTPARRQQAIIAAGRDALARVLIARFGITHSTLTKAIRAGHAGDATDFNAINAAGARALGLL